MVTAVLEIPETNELMIFEGVRAYEGGNQAKARGGGQKVVEHLLVRGCLHLKEEEDGREQRACNQLQHGALCQDLPD